jgi:O-antigen/teichoic acid export membrane protein
MIEALRDKIRVFFTEGNERSLLTKKNIASSFVIKGITIITSFILVPMTIDYVNAERNGIWLTLYSMIYWLNLFDIGLGSGMKNKLAEAKALGEDDLAQRFVSSTYALIFLICAAIFTLLCIINPYLDWMKILKTANEAYAGEISALIWIFIAVFCFNFILNPIKVVVAADQRPAIGSLIDMIGYLLTLAGVFILWKTTKPSLMYLGLVSGFAPILVYAGASIFLFCGRYKKWRPSFSKVDFRLSCPLMSLGVKFSIATIAAIMVTQSLPILIQRLSGGVEVTNYNNAFRLFSVAVNVMAIVILPYWSSFTDAYTKQDFEWMQNAMKYLYRFFIGLLIVQTILLVLSPIIYFVWVNYWIDEPLEISFGMSAAVCLMTCVSCWTTICICPINGIGKIKLQVISSLVEIVLMIPVALWLGKIWGTTGTILAPCVVYLPRSIWAPIQINKLIRQKANGIWGK